MFATEDKLVDFFLQQKNDQDFLIFSLVVNFRLIFILSLGIGSVIKQSVPEDMDMDDDLDDPNEVNTLL